MRNKTIFSIITFFLVNLNVSAQTAETLYKEGLNLKSDGKTGLALEKFKKAIELKPGYTEALYETGWCQNDLGKYKEANKTLLQVVKKWTTVPKAFFELAYSFHKLDYTDSAVKYYKKCIELKQDYSGAYKQLGYIEYDKDNCKECLDLFVKYEANAKTPPEEYLYWYRKGFCYNATKEYVKAKETLTKSLSFKTDNLNTYLELGFASSKLKQDDDAISYFKKAMEVDPKSHVPYNGIAEVYRDNKKDCSEAMNWYRKTLTIKAKERKANFGIGYCLNSNSKYSEAIPYLKEAIEQEPTYTAAFVELGYSYYKIGNDTEAEKNLTKAISLNSQNVNARYYACLMYIKQKNKVMAQKMVNELKSLSSKYAEELQKKVDNL